MLVLFGVCFYFTSALKEPNQFTFWIFHASWVAIVLAFVVRRWEDDAFLEPSGEIAARLPAGRFLLRPADVCRQDGQAR